MDVSKVDLFRYSVWLDERAFETIFHENYAKVYAILFRLTGDRYEADDLTAETFWRLWDHPPAQNENMAGWLYRVATRLGYNALRANLRRKQHETAAAQDSTEPIASGSAPGDPADAVEQAQERERVRQVLRQMPLREVQVLVLRYSGLSYKDIAAVIHTAASSIGTLLARAEAKFEALYSRGEKDAPER
jgi:RNA polymerase sigma factor (sigma-70 family)